MDARGRCDHVARRPRIRRTQLVAKRTGSRLHLDLLSEPESGRGDASRIPSRRSVVEYTPPEKLNPRRWACFSTSTSIKGRDGHHHRPGCSRLLCRSRRSWHRDSCATGEWTITRKRDPKDLAPHERILFKGLLGDRTEVNLADLQTDYAGALFERQTRLYDDSVKSGWFTSNPRAPAPVGSGGA